MATTVETLVSEHRRRQSTGSPEAVVAALTDDVLRDTARVRGMSRGIGWGTEPERFESAAKRELQWRADNGLEFGWRKR